ncbi:cytochrome c oxidase accessory protein CcoG [Gulbenkiania mobilis]|uniref:Cytochrome c oxidase accessory protein FixG n=1 Tax=Gulbenkiania mobilis TaxID=397457 RepID=A0ABY2CVN3_GULMO|nr:cytochrome c oxidase accessory protein FixG [Gulbenkiania mobilis]
MSQKLQFQTLKIYPRPVTGRFNRWRVGFVAVTQLVFFLLPWLMWNGRPAVRFDFGTMRGYLFDLVLLPQDLIYLAGALILSVLGLFLWTTLAGRLWCGFSCPQTVYTQIMLWIEQVFEGPQRTRRLRDAGPWTPEKILRKTASQGAMAVFALWTGLTLVGYFSPMRPMVARLAEGMLGPWETGFALGYAAFTWLLAGHLREAVCKHMCPYARFQGVMYDRDTLHVTYDPTRGEPRGALRRSTPAAARPQGDCVDCGLCVQVCPAGIDIRQGLQYECINCGLCIDACDPVMDKTGRPRGLIRFSTQNALESGQPPLGWLQRPRALFYSGLMIVCSAVMGVGLYLHAPFKVDVLRDRAVFARENEAGEIENAYTLRIFNTRGEHRHYRVRLEGAPGVRLEGADGFQVPADADGSFVVTVAAQPEALSSGSHPLRFVVEDAADPLRTVEAHAPFLMP